MSDSLLWCGWGGILNRIEDGQQLYEPAKYSTVSLEWKTFKPVSVILVLVVSNLSCTRFKGRWGRNNGLWAGVLLLAECLSKNSVFVICVCVCV